MHRKVMMVRAGEAAGVGAAMGAGTGVILTGIHLGLAGVCAVILVGAGAGFLLGMLRRPTSMAVAIEADRQMGSGELLSTAWMVTHTRRPSAVDWEGVVVALAEERCAGMDAARIAVAKMSSRAWAGFTICRA